MEMGNESMKSYKKVIHINLGGKLEKNWKKTGKKELYTDLSTLSTKKGVEKGVDIHHG